MRLPLILLCMLWITPAHANSESDGQSWTQLTAQGPMKDSPVRGYLEVQPRFGNDLSRLSQFILRPAVVVPVGSMFSIWGGYAWTPSFIPTYSKEQRSWEQLQANIPVGENTLISRSRFEQRYLGGQPTVGHRLRQLVRLQLPIGSGDWWAVAWDEVMFNLNTVGRAVKAGYDQNRIFLGANYKISPLFRVEAGYVFVHMERFIPADRLLHVLYLGLNQTF